MTVLAFDCAISGLAVAVVRDGVGLAERREDGRGQAATLLPAIAATLQEAGIDRRALSLIAVTVGPGSFTGLRVGISAARGIALAAGKPAVGLSTLAALAAPHVASRADHVIIAAIDARNEQVYFQVFAPNGTTIVTPRLDRVRAAVRAVPVGAAVVTGSAAELVAAHWPNGSPVPLVETHAAPDIGWVARLGAAAREEGAAPKPLYLRRPDARPQDAGRLPRR